MLNECRHGTTRPSYMQCKKSSTGALRKVISQPIISGSRSPVFLSLRVTLVPLSGTEGGNQKKYNEEKSPASQSPKNLSINKKPGIRSPAFAVNR